jgi:hypothetical protein
MLQYDEDMPTAAELAGAKVKHSAEELGEGETMILTLEDKGILDDKGNLVEEDDVVLENILTVRCCCCCTLVVWDCGSLGGGRRGAGEHPGGELRCCCFCKVGLPAAHSRSATAWAATSLSGGRGDMVLESVLAVSCCCCHVLSAHSALHG